MITKRIKSKRYRSKTTIGNTKVPFSRESVWKKNVLARDGKICSFCKDLKKKTNVYHILKPEEPKRQDDFTVDNGITLCTACHKDLATDPEEYINTCNQLVARSIIDAKLREDEGKYTIIKDTREQAGWDFPKSKKCLGMVTETLSTGDYSIKGLEKKISIERKGSLGEFAKNISEDRFERELDRLDEYEYAFLILEFELKDIYNFPYSSGIPQYKWKYLRTNSGYLIKRLLEIQIDHNVKIIFAGQNGQLIARSILEKMAMIYDRKIK